MIKFLYLLPLLYFIQVISADDAPFYVYGTKAEVTTSNRHIFNEQEIAESGAQDLKDLLSKVPGIQMQSNGGRGQVTTMNMRGTDNRHTLILIDGVRQEDITSIDGSTRLEFIPLHNIKKIEVLKGSQGVLYGASAIGGVINIVTKSRDDSYVRAGVGSFKHRNLAALVGGGSEKLSYLLDLNYSKEEGFSALTPNPNLISDEDGTRSLQGKLQTRYQSDKMDGTLWVKANSSEYDYDAEVGFELGNLGEYKTIEYGTKLYYQFNEAVSLEQTATFENYDRELTGVSSFGPFRLLYEGSRTRLEQMLTFDHSAGVVAMGWELNDERAQAFGERLDSEVKINRGGVYLSSLWSLSFISLNTGLRYERMQNAGQRLTYQTGLKLNLNQVMNFSLNHSTGFKAPTLFHYFTNSSVNLGLKPEKSKSYDATFQLNNDITKMSLTYFVTDYQNYIDFFTNLSDFALSRYINVRGATIKGLEFSYEQTLDEHLSLDIGHTILDTFNEETRRNLVRRPRHQSSVDLSYRYDTVSSSLTYEYMGKRDAIEGVLPSFSLWGLRVSKKIGEKSTLVLKVNNILNKNYEEIRGFQTPGRNLMLSYQCSL